jgi:hypothetical protein
MTTVYLTTVFFLQIRPPEELLDQKCSPLRGELDSSTLKVSGVLLVAVFETRR